MVDLNAERRGISPARDVAIYLLHLRPLIRRAVSGRSAWVSRVGALMEDARLGSLEVVISRSRVYARETSTYFRSLREDLAAVHVPRGCESCHEALTGWVLGHIESAEMLNTLANEQSFRRVRDLSEIFYRGRARARDFNRSYADLVAEVRRRAIEGRPAGPRPPRPARRRRHGEPGA